MLSGCLATIEGKKASLHFGKLNQTWIIAQKCDRILLKTLLIVLQAELLTVLSLVVLLILFRFL